MNSRSQQLLRTRLLFPVLLLQAGAVFVAAWVVYDQRIGNLGAVLLLLALVAATTSTFVTFIQKVVVRPIDQLRVQAEANFQATESRTTPNPTFREIDALGNAMQQVFWQLDHQIREANERRTELDIVLNGMVEGFFAINAFDTVFKLNSAAARMLGVELADVFGRDVREVIRDPEFHAFVDQLRDPNPQRSIEMRMQTSAGEIMASVSGTTIHDENDELLGSLFIFEDVTQVRLLESVRRDFVANVSHELKTPITSIKGFAETMLDGAIEDRETALRFLKIIDRQSDRLIAIIEDLLSLSRIERLEEAGATIDLEPTRLRDVVESACQSCDALASERRTRLEIDCPDEVTAVIDASLFEQAVTNLISNAIKYSPEGSSVFIRGRKSAQQVELEIRDQGSGIPAEHLPRLFERFYRIDPSRSRELGGTGLGLSIVKHIAQHHGGDVHVVSSEGEGSAFTLTVPLRSLQGVAQAST